MYERLRVSVKVKQGSTFMFMCGLPFMHTLPFFTSKPPGTMAANIGSTQRLGCSVYNLKMSRIKGVVTSEKQMTSKASPPSSVTETINEQSMKYFIEKPGND